MNHLILDVCVLSVNQSPVSEVLTDDNIEYEKLSLGLIQVFGQNLHLFWEKLAKTVKDVDVTRFETSNKDLDQLKILSYFTRLLTVALDHQKFLECMKNHEKLRTGLYETKYHSVKRMHLSNLLSEDLDLLLSFFPNVTHLYIESSEEDSFSMQIVKHHGPILKRVILRASAREWVQIIVELECFSEFQIESLECIIEREQTLNHLLDYLSKQQNLSSITLQTNRNLSTVIPKLKILHIDFIQDLVSFKPFQGHEELKELHLRLSRSQHRFQHQNSECFFGHESIPLPTLKKLVLEEFNDKSCVECYENLFQGCSNLEVLSIVQTTISTGVFDLLIKYQKKLRELRIELARVCMICTL